MQAKNPICTRHLVLRAATGAPYMSCSVVCIPLVVNYKCDVHRCRDKIGCGGVCAQLSQGVNTLSLKSAEEAQIPVDRLITDK